MGENGEETRNIEVIIQFEKVGEDHVLIAPGVIISKERFLEEWRKILAAYIERKVLEQFQGPIV